MSEDFPVSVDEQSKEDQPSPLRQTSSSLREVNLLLKNQQSPSSPLIPKPSRPYVKCSFFLTQEGSDTHIFNARLMEMPRKNDVFLIDNTTFEVVSFTRILAFANDEQDYVKEVKVDVLVRKRPVFHYGNDNEEEERPSEERRPFQRRYSRSTAHD